MKSACIAASLFISSVIYAQSYNQDLSHMGITYQITNQTLNISVDEKRLQQSIQQLQQDGQINPRLSKAEISFYSSLIPGSLSIDYTAKILKQLYSTDSTLDKLHVNVYLFSLNLYGNIQKNLCYSFDFDRKLFNTINWVNFKPANMGKVFPNFTTSGSCETIIEDKLLFTKKSNELYKLEDGRRGFSQLFLGSVAEHVIRISPIPVLLVRGWPE